MSQKSGTPKMFSERIVKDIRRATRKQYSAEEKSRIKLALATACPQAGVFRHLAGALQPAGP